MNPIDHPAKEGYYSLGVDDHELHQIQIPNYHLNWDLLKIQKHSDWIYEFVAYIDSWCRNREWLGYNCGTDEIRIYDRDKKLLARYRAQAQHVIEYTAEEIKNPEVTE